MIHVGSTYRLKRDLHFSDTWPILKGETTRIIGKCVNTDTGEETFTLEFDNATRLITLFNDYLREILEPVE